MSDNPLDRMPSFDRVSIRAVLVDEGEDPGAALAEAGFAEVITIPVVLGEAADPSGGILGDGITPNLAAVLETEQEDGFDPAADPRCVLARAVPVRSVSAAEEPSESATTNLPPAFGLQPLAPIRKQGIRKRGS
jgi:hypothetical protein